MAWLKVLGDENDSKQKIYICYWNKTKKYNDRKPTKFFNTPEGWKQARIFLKKFQAAMLDESFRERFYIVSQPHNFSDVFLKFKDSRLIKPASLQMYELAYFHWIKFTGDHYVIDYTEQDYINFVKFLKSKNLAHNTIVTYTKHLRVIWQWMIEKKYTEKNIIGSLKREKKTARTIPDTDLKMLFNYFYSKNKLHYYTIRILYFTGFRISTLIQLKVSDIDFTGGYIYYRNVKADKNSIFPLFHELEQELKKMIKELKLKPDDKLVPYTHRQSLVFFKRAFGTGKDKLDMKYTIHQLRKTLASTLVNSDISMYAAQILLDHSDIKTTNEYYVNARMEKIKEDINRRVKFVKGASKTVKKVVKKSKAKK